VELNLFNYKTIVKKVYGPGTYVFYNMFLGDTFIYDQNKNHPRWCDPSLRERWSGG